MHFISLKDDDVFENKSAHLMIEFQFGLALMSLFVTLTCQNTQGRDKLDVKGDDCANDS